MRYLKTCVPALLIVVLLMSASGCTATLPGGAVAKAADLMNGLSPNAISGRTADADFVGSMADFSIDLFKESITEKENSLISPLSVMLALAMTANGADNETLTQMEKLLGGDIPLAELNEHLFSFAKMLPSEKKAKLSIANSIWFRDDGDKLQVKPDFLQRNADYYGAAAFRSAFDTQTVKDINNWVNSNTDGMIDEILSKIEPLDMLFLINAVAFDAEWQSVYYKEQVRKGDFTDVDGFVQNLDFMHSSEYTYLEDDMATGFIKPYVGGKYSFAALLPDEGISIDEYLTSLNGRSFLDILANAQDTLVFASIPKFEYEYSISMNEALDTLGMHDAFNAGKADFSRIGETSVGPLYISLVLHKTFISVDELGTRAGAATMVAMTRGGAPSEPKIVNLDRPFVFAIIDNATNLPIFIGTLLTVK